MTSTASAPGLSGRELSCRGSSSTQRSLAPQHVVSTSSSKTLFRVAGQQPSSVQFRHSWHLSNPRSAQGASMLKPHHATAATSAETCTPVSAHPHSPCKALLQTRHSLQTEGSHVRARARVRACACVCVGGGGVCAVRARVHASGYNVVFHVYVRICNPS